MLVYVDTNKSSFTFVEVAVNWREFIGGSFCVLTIFSRCCALTVLCHLNEWCWHDQCPRVLSSVSQFSHSVMSDSATPWTAACQASLSITNSQSLLKLMSIESVTPSKHLILCRPFSSCLQSFPASGSFPMSRFFEPGGQSIGVSALISVLPMNIQDLFPLGWTGWISLQSKGLSRVFSNTTVQKHQFFGTQLSL